MAYLNESFKLNNLEIRLNAKVCLARLPEDIGSYQGLLRFNNTFHNILPDMDQVIILSEISESREFKIKSNINGIASGVLNNLDKVVSLVHNDLYKLLMDLKEKDEEYCKLQDKIRSNDLKIESDVGDINIEGFRDAYLEVDTNVGDLEVDKIKNVIAKSDVGDIKIENIYEYVKIETNVGDVRIENLNITKDSEIDSEIGDVKIENIKNYYNKVVNFAVLVENVKQI